MVVSTVSSTTSRYERIVFSDVDGTLVHYPASGATAVLPPGDEDDESSSPPLVHLPPSKTGARGALSMRTLALCHRLRNGERGGGGGIDDADTILARRVPLVLISGMRTTTLFQRLPYLPRADAYVSESGGRIFYPRRRTISTTTTTAAAPPMSEKEDKAEEDHIVHPISYPNMPPGYDIPFALVEDMDWRDRMSQDDSAGPDGYDDIILETNNLAQLNDNVVIDERRRGRLWECARSLIDRGYIIDTEGYATSFRINRKQQTNDDLIQNFDNFIADCCRSGGGDGITNNDNNQRHRQRMIISNDLGRSTNLGCVDVYPAMSGKRNCAEYLMHKFLSTRSNNVDDDCIDIVGGEEEHERIRSETTDSSGSQLPPVPVSLKTNAYFLCDDDNDIELAMACIAAYLPSVTSESIRTLATTENSSLIIMEDTSKGIVDSFATEAALEAIIEVVESR